MVDLQWVDGIAASLTLQSVGLWLAFVGYLIMWPWRDLGRSTTILYAGILLLAGSLAWDKMVWAASNLAKAASGSEHTEISAWYAANVPWLIVGVQVVSVVGVLFLIRLVCLERLPRLTVGRMAVGCGVLGLGIALGTAWIRAGAG